MNRSHLGRLMGLLLVLVLSGATGAAQSGRRGGRFAPVARFATPESFDGGFNFCRVVFRSGGFGYGNRWNVDYPKADVNLSIRLSELTKAQISRDRAGEPNHLLVRLTDEALFQCPFIMMTEVGGAYLEEDEAVRLRDYLLKGGFLWADDFWGRAAWENWAREIGKVLPPGEYPIRDLSAGHPIFHALFEVARVPQVPSINFWWSSGGATSERGYDSREPHARAISDQGGRLMVLMTHNTDIGDSWEQEALDPDYFYRFSVDGYAVAINVLLHAMTH